MKLQVLGTGSADGWPNPMCRCDSCTHARDLGVLRTHTSVVVDDVIVFDLGPDVARAAERHGVSLANVEHIVIGHGHPDHLDGAPLLWRSWVAAPTPLTVHAPANALSLLHEWIPPTHVNNPLLTPIAAREARELVTSRGTYELTALTAAHATATTGDEHAIAALVYVLRAPSGERIGYFTDTGPLPATTMAALTQTPLDVLFIDETFGTFTSHATGHHDLTSLALELNELRNIGAITATTDVIAVHLSHHNPIDIDTRLALMGARTVVDGTIIDTTLGSGSGHTTLLIGGARSGKSTFAESMAAPYKSVTYVATSRSTTDDAEWTERVRQHQRRRPAHWTTIETTELCEVLDGAAEGSAVLIDCLTLWLTALLDDLDAWDANADLVLISKSLAASTANLCDSLARCRADVMVVTNEVGQGVVPPTASGRLFRDEMGRLNTSVASACDDAYFIVAGRCIPMTTLEPLLHSETTEQPT